MSVKPPLAGYSSSWGGGVGREWGEESVFEVVNLDGDVLPDDSESVDSLTDFENSTSCDSIRTLDE